MDVCVIVGLHHVVVGLRREEARRREASRPCLPEGKANKLGVEPSEAGQGHSFLAPSQQKGAFCGAPKTESG